VLRILRRLSSSNSENLLNFTTEQYLESTGLLAYIYARSAVTNILGVDVPKIIADVLAVLIGPLREELERFLRDPRIILRLTSEVDTLKRENESLRTTLSWYTQR